MQGLNVPLEEFLRPFFDAGETVCLRVFADRKDTAFKGLKLECPAGKIESMADTLRKHNEQNRGIFFVVNSGGHEDKDITRINAQFVECDTLPVEEQLARIEAFSLSPSIIVRTQKSLHTYWLVKNAEVPRFRTIQKALIQQFDGDPACVNESRVLRLPGFMHCKTEPFRVECVKFSPELRYTQDELAAALPAVTESPPPCMAEKGNRKGLQLVLKRCDFLKHCQEHAATLPEHDWYAMITNLAVFDGGEQAIHTLSQSYPSYSQIETQAKIAHFMDSGTKPITCRTIAEKGFVCPRMEPCGCKAPAALAYQPLSVEELRSFLKLCEVKHNPVDDIGTATAYVIENLYNVEPVVAESFINYEMKDYFGLKAGDMKPLIALHRNLYREYMESKETKRQQYSDELPSWYEPTDHGLRFLPGLLADHMAKNVDAFYGAGSYYFYGSGVYHAGEDLLAQAKAREFMIPRYANMVAISDTVGQWRMLIHKPVREINCNAFIINLRNGLYNVLDGSFKPHTPAYIGTVQINATYDPDAKCPAFLSFLHSILDEEEISLIQEIFGYLLIPINKAQKSFVFVGAPNAGKSTLLSVAQDILLGCENVSNIPWQSLGDRFNKAELFGKLANIFADLPSKNIDDNGLFKALTGEDYITAERKNKDPFSFRPYARLLFSCNEIPRNYGDRSDGFYRRLIIIRFDRSIPQEQRDPNLREKLAVERDGILTWALDGLGRLLDDSYVFSETEKTRAELTRYRVESNSVLSFVEECCELAPDAETVREEMFSKYKEYCHNAGLKALSQRNFNKEIEAMPSEVVRAKDRLGKRRTWRGIGMVS